MSTDVIVLAAGLSTRFNGNKLMYVIDGKPLLGYCLDLCEKLFLNRHVNSVNVVASNETVFAYIYDHHPNFKIIPNNQPSEGISSSIQKGILAVKTMYPLSENVLILLGDMPYLKENHLKKLLSKAQNPNIEIAASHEIGSSENDFRNPIVISSKLYDKLLLSTGDKGAKALIQTQYALAPGSVGIVNTTAHMLSDIDTI